MTLLELLETLWDSTPFWGIIGLIGGAIVSSIFFRAGKKKKLLHYKIVSTPLVEKNIANTLGLKITIDDTSVQTLTSTTISFFNAGTEKIEGTDFADLEPLGIRISGTILHLQGEPDVKSPKNMNLHFQRIDNTSANILFNFWRPHEVLILTVLHDGQLSVFGDIKDGEIQPIQEKSSSPLLCVVLTIPLFLLLIAFCIISSALLEIGIIFFILLFILLVYSIIFAECYVLIYCMGYDWVSHYIFGDCPYEGNDSDNLQSKT